MEVIQEININDRAKVVLTESGARTLNSYNLQFHLHTSDGWGMDEDEKWFPTNYKEGDEYVSELWNIMHIFGKEIFCGASAQFFKNKMILYINS